MKKVAVEGAGAAKEIKLELQHPKRNYCSYAMENRSTEFTLLRRVFQSRDSSSSTSEKVMIFGSD